jgi:VanZ family protein
MQSSLLSNRLYRFLKEKKVFLVYIPLAIYWIILFAATTIPTDAVPQLFNAQDKLEHFSAYSILAVLLLLTLHFQQKNRLLNRRAILFTFIFLALYGAVDELHQYFIPGRYCDIYDWSADIIGGLLGLLLVSFFIRGNTTLPVEVGYSE